MLNDLKYALRVIRKYPLSNSVIVFTVAALVAVVGSWYGSLRVNDLSHMPFNDPDRMFRLWRTGKAATTDQYPYDLYQTIREQNQSFEKIGALTIHHSYTLTGVGEPLRLRAVHCNAEALEVTGMRPVIGRFFSPLDEQPGHREIVVLSEQVWRKHFQARRDILGKTIPLNETPHTVVGVAPAKLRATHLAREADLWMPSSWTARAENSKYVHVFARLRDGVQARQAQAELDVLIRPLEQNRRLSKYEASRFKEGFYGVKIAPLNQRLYRSGQMHGEELVAIIFSLVLAGCVILIAGFNMTSLLLVQATSRAREMAVRLSVGAGRWRIVRQMLIESLILSTAGGLLGALLSYAVVRLGNRQMLGLGFDPGLFGLTLGLAMVVGALVSIVPALRAGRTDLSHALNDGGKGSASRRRHRLRNFLVGAQIAMATILSITAFLFASGFVRTLTVDLNLDPQRVLTVEIELDRQRYGEPETLSTYADRALKTLEVMPGVERAVVSFPGIGANWNLSRTVQFAATDLRPADSHAGVVYASPDYFAAAGVRLLNGRRFSSGSDVLHEAVVNEEFLRRFSPDRDPVGETFTLGGLGNQVFTVVGVVEDHNPKIEFGEVHPRVHLSHRHPILSTQRLGVTVVTETDSAAFGPVVRKALGRLDSVQVIGPAVPVSAIIERNLRPVRFASMVIVGMALFGLGMSLIGVYAVVAYAVIERTQEMGIRMALGANRARVVGTIMSEGTRLMFWGGIPAAILTCVAFHVLPLEEFPGLDAADPLVYFVSLLSLALAGVTAALLPARKMARLNPSQALRYE